MDKNKICSTYFDVDCQHQISLKSSFLMICCLR